MTVYYVSPFGSDSASGTQATGSGSSGPFATLARAQQAMRASAGPDTVYVGGGTYALSAPITLTAADSGSSFLAMPGERAIVSGGTAVTGWTAGADGIWRAHVPTGSVTQFTVNGVTQVEARYPNFDPAQPETGGWLWAKALPSGRDPAFEMAYNKADFSAGQLTVGAKITVFDELSYEASVLTIASIDTSAGVMRFVEPSNYDIGVGSRFYVSGTSALLNAPGEWWFDKASQTLSYRPPAGFTGSGAVASGGDRSAFVLDGADNVSIKGLTFSDWATTAATDEAVSSAAIIVREATGATIDGNAFENVAMGVLLDDESHGNTVSNNNFRDTLSGAIDASPTSHENLITNNTIDGANTVFRVGGAIRLSETWGNVVSHNLIQNVPRMGIEEQNYTTAIKSGGNIIEYNVILNSGQESSDVGAIYLFAGADPGALGDIIRYNKIIDAGGLGTTANGFVAGQHASWGIYLDDDVNNAKVYGNFVSGTSLGGVMLHGGINNEVYNNILVNNLKFGIELLELDHPMTGTSIHHNLVEIPKDAGSPVVSLDSEFVSASALRDNIYVSPTGVAPLIADRTYAQWRAIGGDAGSDIVTSAGFTNAAAGDYSFASGAFALTQGMTQLPWDLMGPTGGVATKPPPATESPSETLTGGAGNDKLVGGAGDDRLSGGNGHDTLDGAGGADVMIGGLGNDIFYVDNVGDRVVENPDEGNDVVYAKISYTIAATSDINVLRAYAGSSGLVLTGNDITRVIEGGAGADTLQGGANPNRLVGGAGNDTLNGGGDADMMVGGLGNDVYHVDTPGDAAMEAIGEGTDTIYAGSNYRLREGSEIEFLRADAGSTGLILRGNELGGRIIGGAGADTLFGSGGADILTGGGGADRFWFAALSDSTPGAAGRDTITDFSALAGDKIDLRLIDARTNLSGDQAFTFVGNAAFSGRSGELRYAAAGSDTVISGDVNGDRIADFSILSTGLRAFVPTDFML